MTKRELTGTRDLSYSHAHRGHGTGHPDSSCTYQDIDGNEYCASCGDPLLLVETAIGNETTTKGHKPLRRLAERANVPAVLIFYELGDLIWCGICRFHFHDIVKLWVRDVWGSDASAYAPDDWWTEIERIHADHECEL